MACLLTALVGRAEISDQLVGVWLGHGWVLRVELLLRSDGRYEAAFTTSESQFGPSIDRGRYEVVGQSIRMTSYTYFQAPSADTYSFVLDGDSLSLSGGSDLLTYNLSMEYQLQPGSREEVLAREKSSQDLVRRWTRHVLFSGDEEWTFRPGGYYCLKTTSENVPGFIQYQRGRYERSENHLTLRPYGGNTANCDVDIFGTTLTMISSNSFSGQFNSYQEVPDSATEVATKAAEAQAFLSDPIWPTGVWEIQKENDSIDLLLRPDGYYTATNTTPLVHRTLWGRYTLAGAEINLIPFVGQQRYALDEATFGMEEQPFTVDYYDGELQLIDHKPGILQSVTLARLSPGSRPPVVELVRQAQTERAGNGWYLGIWEGTSPAAWTEFTFRPDGHYSAKAGATRVPTEVERGEYVVAPKKVTLAPFAGNGRARGFELDLYGGNLFLIGASERLVITRKIEGSEGGVIERTLDPSALKGERGSILGLWTANRPTESIELVFREDGQFRMKRCSNNTVSYDYGLYAVNMPARTLVYDSRVAVVQYQRLDFYGDTMTIYGGTNTTPSTYTVNLGQVDAAIAASFATDAAEAQVNAQWLERTQLGPTGPNGLLPENIPADPNPEQIFPAPTVFTHYQYYRKLIYKILYETVVVDTQQWHFMPNGRILVRFTIWPPAGAEVIWDQWGAYKVEPKPSETDIYHVYADNNVTVKLDVGDVVPMTLENGRRVLFSQKTTYPLDAWAAEHEPIACQVPGNADASLINTGVSLTTAIAPDPVGAAAPFAITIARPAGGTLTLGGTIDSARTLVLECAGSLTAPCRWNPMNTNCVPAGAFSFTIPEATESATFFRVRAE